MLLAYKGHVIIATLNVVTGEWLALDEAGLSEAACGSWVHAQARCYRVAFAGAESLSLVRAKVYGKQLGNADLRAVEGIMFWPMRRTRWVNLAIVRDIAAGRYADIYLSAFIVACAGDRLDLAETVALTRAMIDAGEELCTCECFPAICSIQHGTTCAFGVSMVG